MPMRLWSTVVSHEVTLPRRQSARYGWTCWTSTAIRSTPARSELLRVEDEGVDLLVRPLGADRRHLALPVPEQQLEALPVGEQRVPAEVGPDVARAEPVALLADAPPLLAAEVDQPRVGGPVLDERLVLRAGHDLHPCSHRSVLDAAQLVAAGLVEADRRLEPRLVHLAGDRIELPAEVRHPPRVDDVGQRRADLLVDDVAGRGAHAVDRDRTVRVRELPVELVPVDPDRRRVRRVGRRRILDPWELVEDERADRGEEDDWDHRPSHLEPRRAVHLRAFRRPFTLAAAVLDDEEDERPLDD